MESAIRAMLIVLLVFGLCGCGGKALPDAATVKKNLTVSQFKPGQIWTYPTRENGESSRLTILKVEHDESFGTVVHIQVSNLSIPNASAPSGKTTEIRHMPFADESLDSSRLMRACPVRATRAAEAGFTGAIMAASEVAEDGQVASR